MPVDFDARLAQMMRRLDARGYLRNTLLVFFTDHGQRLKHYAYGTELGKLERYLPFLSIRLPQRLSAANSSYRDNLLANSDKLVSFFDIHQTLRQFLHINTHGGSDTDDNDDEQRRPFRTNDHAERTLRGISLLERVPLNRSCRDALIPLKCCSCFRPTVLRSGELVAETGMSSIEAAAGIVLDYIRQLVMARGAAAADRCVPFTLDRVVAIKRMQINDVRVYVLTLVAQPGDAWFDAQLRLVEPGTLHMQSVPTRLSVYGKQSHCVNDSLLANYCFCRDMLTSAANGTTAASGGRITATNKS